MSMSGRSGSLTGGQGSAGTSAAPVAVEAFPQRRGHAAPSLGRGGALEAVSGAALGTYTNNSSTLNSQRVWRMRTRRRLWAESSLERVRKCGRVRVADAVGLRLTDGHAGLAGLSVCGSVWACPCCNVKVMTKRAFDISDAYRTWTRDGGLVSMHTLTMRHRKGQPLATLWDALAAAWAAVTSGRAWVKDREAHGVEGWVRVVEVTHGANGWHVHVHVLMFGGESMSVSGLHGSMFKRWSGALKRKGLGAPLPVGQDARLAWSDDIGGYLGKVSARPKPKVGLEMTHSQGKTGGRTRQVWALLDDVFDQGDADSLTLWHEYEKASHGRRAVGWSHGFRQRLRLADEEADEVVAAEETGTVVDTVAWISPEGWAQLLAGYDELVPQLLAVAEAGGPEDARAWLREHGVPFDSPVSRDLP